MKHRSHMDEDLLNWCKEKFRVARRLIYEVDDLVDKLLTRGHKERRGVQWLFPNKMHWMDHFNMELEKLVDDYRKHKIKQKARRVQRKETYSDVGSVIVGREDEVQALLQRLLRSASDVLSIVGLPGIGKTTLAKLLFHHTTIRTEFPLRIWVWVSKGDKSIGANCLLCDILNAATPDIIPLSPSDLSINLMENHLLDVIREVKFLLVLDDVWNVDPEELHLIKNILRKGGEGSRILVTTRFKDTAQLVGDLIPWELQGLSQPDSWSLFQKIAFTNDSSSPPSKLVGLAKQIVRKYCSHPMAIRELARQIGQYIKKLQPLQERRLAISNHFWTFESLKVSYYDLGLTLKSCFSYCALFPLNSVMHKRMLVSLWIAQGYIVSSKEDQSIEDDGDECFSVLLGIGFLEAVETEEWGEIVSCKMNALMYTVAMQAAGEEFCETNYTIGESAFHLFYSGNVPGNSLFTETKIRSYLRDSCSQVFVDPLGKQWRSLRTLDLHGLHIQMLPDTFGGLIHLRYLDLSHNIFLKALPNSIVKLKNLQTLDLRFCALLKELPQELSRLSALRCLDIFGCDGLTRMPPGMEKLSCLHHLSLFVVADGIPCAEIKDLKKLVSLRGRICISIPRSYTNVKRIDWNGGCLEEHKHLQEVWVRFLESHSVDNSDQRVVNYHQIVLEKLQPHGNIKKLMLWDYQGAIIAKWGRAQKNWIHTLGCLCMIELRSCEKLKQLPLLSSLPHLKSLKLHGLRELEYLENNPITSRTRQARAFFPSLQELEITNAPKLRGFWNGITSVNWEATFPVRLARIELRSCEKLQKLPLLSNLPLLKSMKLYGLSSLEGMIISFLPSLEELEIVDAPKLRGCGSAMSFPQATCFMSLKSLVLANLPELREFCCIEGGPDNQKTKLDEHKYTLQFHCLSELRVSNCPKLMSMPLVPTLEVLKAINIHVELLKHIVGNQEFRPSSSTSSTLRKVDIVAVHELHYLPTRLSNVESLTIRQSELLDTLSLTYVKRLTIQECGRLKHISPGLNHLTCLEELEIKDCEDLDFKFKDDGEFGIGWQNLKTLRLSNISKCESLTQGLGYLTTLEKLSLSWLYDLRGLPDEIELLDHLTQLTIRCCPNLTYLPESLGRLCSLEKLEIECCTRLKRLPDSLHTGYIQIVIRNCPQLPNAVS